MDGLINVLKEPGLTSHDVVQYLRRLFKFRKIGHCGTLDPGAAGVLPICLGQGTRVSEFLMMKPKKYRAEITFGIETDTSDAGGSIIRKEPNAKVEPEELMQILKQFQGEIYQTPPMVSAIHYEGKRLYELAREGKTVERKARKVNIYSLKLLAFYDTHPYPRALLDIHCSKGTYIRTLCSDIGKALGCGAYLSFLVRTESGSFKLEDSFTLNEIKELWLNQDLSFLLPIDFALEDFPAFVVKEKAVKSVLNGMPVAPSGIKGAVGISELPKTVRLYSPDKVLLALADYIEYREGSWVYKPKKVFQNLKKIKAMRSL
ncbi:MAG: tRNA pseudouridine(55) synthase TruB [Thermacetogeniaceae bacterium]